MKKFYLFICLTVLVVNSRGQLLYEPFNYTPHATLGLYTQSNAAWLNVNTGDSILVTAGSLSYPGLPASIGNKVAFAGSGIDCYRNFASQTTGTVFSSFILNVSALGSLNATGGYFSGFVETGSTTLFGAVVWVRLSTTAGKYNIGISTRSSTSAISWLSNELDPGTAYFVVNSYNMIAGAANDISKIWLNTTAIGGAEPVANATAVSGTSDLASVGNIFLRQDSDPETAFTSVDEIRVGTTWADVTPSSGVTPSLVAGSLAGFGNVTVGTNSTSQSFTLSGSNLTGAPGNITITAPSTDFQVSNNNSTWGGSTTIPYASATLASTNVYARFTPQSAGLKTGNISISGGGATASVAVSGTGVAAGGPPPAPIATAATGITATGFTANWNASSGATNYFLDVYTLTTGTVTDTVVGWNFGTNTAANQTADEGNINNLGIQTVTPNGVGTVSWPGGPGAPNSFSVSANGWDNGADTKYWSVDVNTTGASNITVSSLQGASNTGPKDFKLQYKVGAAGTWTDVTGGVVTLTTAVAAGNPATWGAITNLALPVNANNQPLISVRWIMTSNTAINAAPVAAGGTSRISAIYIKGDVAGGSAPVYVPGYQNLSAGNVTSYNVTGLSNNTTYYYVVRANNASGTSANSNEITVTTTASVTPTIITTALTAFGNICTGNTGGPNSFTINGTNLTNADVTVGPLAGYTFSTTSGGTYTSSLTLAQPGGTYSQAIFVRFSPVAVQSYNGNIPVNGGGIASVVNVAASGAGINTSTSVTSGAATAVTFNSATVAGSIPSTGCTVITSYGIVYSTTSGFVTGTQVASTNLSGGNFSSALSGLTASTTYYYKAYATDGSGTIYGTELSFITAAPPVILTATALTAFGSVCTGTTTDANSFTLNGSNLTAANITVGPLTGYVFSTTLSGVYSNSLTLTQAGGTLSQTVFVKFSPTAVQSYNGNIPVTGGGTTGTLNVAASGSGVNTAASVTTAAASNLSTYSATLSGTIAGTGCSAITVYGVEFSSINGFANGTGTQVISTNVNGSNYYSLLSGLVQGATYYYKAYAINNGGTAYGAQQTFTLPSVGNGFKVRPVPAVRGNSIHISMNNLTPGYYGLLIHNSAGQLVYQKNINIQSNFIDQDIMVPANLPRGIYRLQLMNYEKVVAARSITIETH